MSRTTTVGVIGLGSTGRTVARRLLDDGFAVTVHDRDAWTVATMAATGARPARLPADAAEPADLVFVHVPDEAAVDEVLFECGGVGDTLRDGGAVVVAAITGPAFLHSAADRLGALGLRTVEAWFPGNDGTPATTVFVGCSPEDLATVAPALGEVAEHVVHVGPLGSVCALRTAVTALCAVPPVAPRDGRARSTAALARAVADAVVDSRACPGPRQHVAGVRHCTAPGVLTVDELMDLVDAVRARRDAARSGSGTPGDEARQDANCLGLASWEFEDVVSELERSNGIPLRREVARCSSPVELVALVNRQVTSGV
jgi:6-phosphogluconate dehydrogenase-like protein